MAQESVLRIVIDSRNAERNARALASELDSIEKKGDFASKSMDSMSVATRQLAGYMAGAVHDHFQDGAMFAFHFIDKDELKRQRDRMDYYQWHLNPTERMTLDYKRK